MPKFFLKALFFIVVLSLMLNSLGKLANKVAPLEDWRVYYQQVLTDVKERNEVIEAITLGNSHADSIDYSILEMDGQSMALGAADLFEIEKIVLSLEHKLPKLNTAFIAISYYSFSWDNAKYQYLQPRRIGFYSMLPMWSPIEGDLPNFTMGKLDTLTHVMSVVRSDGWKGVWQGLITNPPSANFFTYDGVQTSSIWGQCSHYTEDQLYHHAKEVAGKNISISLLMAGAHPNLEQDTLDALARTIERLQSRGVQVILYTPTYYEKYNLYFEEKGSGIIDPMRLALDELQQTYGVNYYDFSSDSELMTQPELFYNSDHLGECGHKVLTAKLLKLIGGDSNVGP